MAENKVKFNLKNVHYAIWTPGSGNTEGSYATPVAIPGAVNLALSPEGDEFKFYADGNVYYSQNVNNGYKGTLELAMIPQGFRTGVLGEILNSSSVLVEDSSAATVYFALGFEVDGDDSGRKTWLYKCAAARPDVAGQTKEDSISVKTETLNITCYPNENGKVKCSSTATTPAATVSNWFSAVVTP